MFLESHPWISHRGRKSKRRVEGVATSSESEGLPIVAGVAGDDFV